MERRCYCLNCSEEQWELSEPANIPFTGYSIPTEEHTIYDKLPSGICFARPDLWNEEILTTLQNHKPTNESKYYN